MRLGQFARKYDLSPQEIISFLDEVITNNTFHHANARLDDETKLVIAKHFSLTLETTTYPANDHVESTFSAPEEGNHPVEENNEKVIDIPEEDVAPPLQANSVEKTHEIEDEEAQTVPDTSLASPTEESSIETDKLLALLEDENAQIDLSSITHIKAPKRALEGLKVVGKIDLPDPKTKKESEKKDAVDEQGQSRNGNGRQQNRQLSEEERERKRLKEKNQREKRERRKEEQRKEKERQALKALKEAHYREKLERRKSKQPQHLRGTDKNANDQNQQENQVSKPKTLLGKFWRWLNT